MKIGFFNNDCNEPERTVNEFGICDDQNNTKAYTDITNVDKWVAIVKNGSLKRTTFTAIDNCLEFYIDDTTNKESSCDGMLSFNDSLFLVELKNQRANWISEAIKQLENTIRLLYENDNIDRFRYKKAYACNKKHPYFQVIDSEKKKRFFDKTGFRIDVQTEIIIK